jgi:hypothetical protein
MPPGCIDILMLNRNLLPTEKSPKRRCQCLVKVGPATILISNIGRNEVNELGYSLSLIGSTARSHTEGTGRTME